MTSLCADSAPLVAHCHCTETVAQECIVIQSVGNLPRGLPLRGIHDTFLVLGVTQFDHGFHRVLREQQGWDGGWDANIAITSSTNKLE